VIIDENSNASSHPGASRGKLGAKQRLGCMAKLFSKGLQANFVLPAEHRFHISVHKRLT
jgi:hypothetical protein